MAIALAGSSDGNNIAKSKSTPSPSPATASTSATSASSTTPITTTAAATTAKTDKPTPMSQERVMSDPCSICTDGQGTRENPLVYCDGCNLAAHKACYGILKVPDGDWFCRRCEAAISQDDISCELCPSKGGAFKKTANGKWAHVVCALYIPEVKFKDVETMEPILTEEVPPERFTKSCFICTEKGNSSSASSGGAVIDCHKNGCKQSFHVTCAQEARLLCEQTDRNNKGDLVYCGFCRHHFRKSKTSKKQSTNPTANTSNSSSGKLNSSSSLLDSASDSSQDNDSRNHRTSGKDDKTTDSIKNSATTATSTVTKPAMPTTTTTSTNPTLATPSTSSSSSPKANSEIQTTKATTLSILSKTSESDDSLNTSTSSNKTTTSSSSASSGGKTPQKKKRATKGASDALVSPQATATSTNSISNSNPSFLAKQDAYNFSPSPDISSRGGGNAKRKQLDTQLLPSSNLSISTSSPTPSNAATSSTSTTLTNIPSPALISPNLINRLAGSSPMTKTGSSTTMLKGTTQQSHPATGEVPNISLPLGQAGSLHTRHDPKKTTHSSASLLSTVVPMTLQDQTIDPPTIQNLAKPFSNTLGDNQPSTSNSQSTLPPVTNTADTNKTKPGAKTPRKKPATSATPEAPKTESKPKASRSRKAAATIPVAAPAAISTTLANGSATPTPKRGKGKNVLTNDNAILGPTGSGEGLSMTLPPLQVGKKAPVTATPSKRKSRSASNESGLVAQPTTSQPSAAKRPRKKKSDSKQSIAEQQQIPPPLSSLASQPYLPSSSNMMGPGTQGPLMINTPHMYGRLPLTSSLPSYDGSLDPNAKHHFSPNLSPYINVDPMSAPSLSRASLSRLYASTPADQNAPVNPLEDLGKAFEELRDNTWNNLSKCVLEQAQHFDLASLVGSLYVLRNENDKLANRVREATMKRDQLSAMSSRLDMPGPLLTQHLNATSPNFQQVVAGLTQSPKGLSSSISSPGSMMSKPPGPPYTLGGGPLGLSGYLDRSSPLVGQPHSSVGGIKVSSISTPSPPIGALMAQNSSNRAGLIAVNQPPYPMPNVYPSMNPMTHLGPPTSQGSSFHARQ